VRENLFGFADREYRALAAEANRKSTWTWKPRFHEAMALYRRMILSHETSGCAEDAIRRDADLAALTRDEHMAMIRRWRGIRSLHAGIPRWRMLYPRDAARFESTENEFIGDQLHALRGTWLVEQHKYREAIPELSRRAMTRFAGFAGACETRIG